MGFRKCPRCELNYILDGDYEGVGFIAYSQPDGSGHIFNYILQDGYYYFTASYPAFLRSSDSSCLMGISSSISNIRLIFLLLFLLVILYW